MNPILKMPTEPGFAKSVFGFRTAVKHFISPTSLKRCAVSSGNALLFCRFTLPPMRWSQAAPWIGFFANLQRHNGIFAAFDPFYRPSEFITRLVDPIYAERIAGKSDEIRTTGWGVRDRVVLTRGSYLAINNELKVATGVVRVNSSGVANIGIFPPLRQALATRQAVELKEPGGRFVMVEDEFLWSVDDLLLGTLAFSAEEWID